MPLLDARISNLEPLSSMLLFLAPVHLKTGCTSCVFLLIRSLPFTYRPCQRTVLLTYPE